MQPRSIAQSHLPTRADSLLEGAEAGSKLNAEELLELLQSR
ncbi:MAG: hypothetical protein NW241_01985 [Bacteroidia bacterium]|nr:hypothetical protein [Bacteroidia bacterium]